MEYQDSELTQALREKNYYKSNYETLKSEVLLYRVILTVCVLSVLFFLGRTLAAYYQAF